VRQPSDDRALYYRQLRQTIHTVFLPELTSAQAIDAAGLVDRILAEFIVEEESAPALSAEFGGDFEELLHPGDRAERPVVSPPHFHELRGEAAEVVARTAGSADRGERELARQLVEIERRFLERVDRLRCPVLASTEATDPVPAPNRCSVTNEEVTDYLHRRLTNSPDVEVVRLSVVPGGRSKETILVSLKGTRELPEEVILRKDRPVGVLQTKAADEFGVIKAVHDFGGVPIPEPFFAERDARGLGDGTFLVMERVRGHKAGEFFPELAAPSRYRREIGLQLAAALARLHSLPLERLGQTSLDAGQAVTEDSVVAAVDSLVARIGELTGPPCASVHLAHRWLLEYVSDVAPAPRLCLLQGDVGLHNMLVDGARVTALVDWEAAAIGPPARELAAAWSAATALLDWPTFVQAYLQAGGQPGGTDRRAVQYYRVLSSLGGFMASRTGGDLFRSGAKRDLQTAHSGLDSHFRCARNLARALGDAMADGLPSS
jgi:aminoglycoside phosphotransferase (APT) family kinase protein